MRERYGPSIWAYLLIVLGVAAIALLVAYPDPDLRFKDIVVINLVPVFFVMGGANALVWYEIDDRELRRSGISGSLTVAWEDIGGIRGSRVHGGGSYNQGSSSVLIQRVIDRYGNTIFKLNPLLSRRRELARRIIKKVVAVSKREEAAGR
jgi:hypothetical protein